jgi:hypothetical protein
MPSEPLYADAVLDRIPKPDVVRDLLAKSIREAALLRSLLRVAERRQRYLDRAKAGVSGQGEGVARAS